MAGGTADHTGRTGTLLGSRDRDIADPEDSVSPAVAPDRGGSLLELMGLDLPVPDHSTLSRRSRTLAVASQAASGPVHLLIDSTGGRPNSDTVDTGGEVVFQRSCGFLKGCEP